MIQKTRTLLLFDNHPMQPYWFLLHVFKSGADEAVIYPVESENAEALGKNA
jgi:hypothetical protein